MGWHPTPTLIFTYYMISSTNPGVPIFYFLLAFAMFCIVPVWYSDSHKCIMIWRHTGPVQIEPPLINARRATISNRIYMENTTVVMLQLRMWVSLWQGTHVLTLAAAWLVLRKEFLVSFLVRGNSYHNDDYHNAWQELEDFSFFIHVVK